MASVDAPKSPTPRLPYAIVCHPKWYVEIVNLVPPGVLVEYHPKHPVDQATLCETCEAFGRVLQEYECGHIQS